MTEIVLMKVSNILVPHDQAAAAFIQKMKAGELTHADFKRVANILCASVSGVWVPKQPVTQAFPSRSNYQQSSQDGNSTT